MEDGARAAQDAQGLQPNHAFVVIVAPPGVDQQDQAQRQPECDADGDQPAGPTAPRGRTPGITSGQDTHTRDQGDSVMVKAEMLMGVGFSPRNNRIS